MEALVSIITPCKNAAPWLLDCYESIKNQTYSKWEWVVVDDHSDDSTLELLYNIREKDSRIHVHSNSGNGIIPALSKAFAYSTGEYITRMDADDKMPPERLSQMVNLLKKSSKNTVVTGLVKYFSTESVSNGYLEYQNWINQINLSDQQWNQIYRECVIASPNWITRKSDLIDCGGFDELSYPEDYDLVFQWYKNGFTIQTVPGITLHWREHPKRTSRTSENYQQEAFFGLKLKRFIELDYKGRPLIIWGNNIKSKLAQRILKKHKVNVTIQDLQDFKSIESIKDPQLLIAVYPTETERIQIINYLNSINLIEGENWWWL